MGGVCRAVVLVKKISIKDLTLRNAVYKLYTIAMFSCNESNVK